MEVLQSDQAVPSSFINSKPCNTCRITEFKKVHETSVPVLQVPLLLQDRQLHTLTMIMEERRQIAGLSYGKVLRMATAEMVAVFLIMFSVCGTAIANKKTNGDMNLLGFATAGGLSVMMMVFAVGHISGAHLNPAVTLAFASKRAFPLQLVPIYILAQFVGSLVAVGVLQALTNDVETSLTVPSASTAQAFIVELILGFNLMFVATAVSTGSSNSGELAGIAVGATVILNVLLGGAISGAAMSPMRSLGPAIVANNYDNVWIYIIAPPIGALTGAWTHTLLQISS
ncbi:hypothetical protein M758_9G063300 [Ceratodon purpureus]|nr:hypothetical protein M758_9G063300 [Ceratodon purpureus]